MENEFSGDILAKEQHDKIAVSEMVEGRKFSVKEIGGFIESSMECLRKREKQSFLVWMSSWCNKDLVP